MYARTKLRLTVQRCVPFKKSAQNRRLLISLLFLTIALLVTIEANAQAQLTGEDITKRCSIAMPGSAKDRAMAFDGKYGTGWMRYDNSEYTIAIELPTSVRQGGLYLCFLKQPTRLVCKNEEGEFFRNEGYGFAHRYVPFVAKGSISIHLWGDEKGFSLSEMYVFSGQDPPAWVQQWQPSYEKADLLVLVAHPDDEFLWMGGAIPYYVLERNKRVAVAYMTCPNWLRRSEMLNALWTAGVRNYPFIGTFNDKRLNGINKSVQLWGGWHKVQEHITTLYRKLRPSVVLTHDMKGEYGHPAHIITARAAIKSLELAADEKKYAAVAKEHGTWDVPKMYVHLFKENPIVMDWQQAIAARGDISAMQVSMDAFAAYRSQQARYKILPDVPYSPTRFGLYRSLVGLDVVGNDFFENIE